MTHFQWHQAINQRRSGHSLVKTYIQIKSSIPFFRPSQVVLLVKNPPANAGDIRDAGLIPGSERSPGGGHGNPLQYSCLENSMDRGAWWATVHCVIKNWTCLKQLSIHAHTISLYSTSRSHMQSRNSDTNGESKHMNVKGKGRIGWTGRWDWHISTTDTMYKMDNQGEPTV